MMKKEAQIRKVEPVGKINPTRPPLKDDDASQEAEKRRQTGNGKFGEELDRSIQDLLKKNK